MPLSDRNVINVFFTRTGLTATNGLEPRQSGNHYRSIHKLGSAKTVKLFRSIQSCGVRDRNFNPYQTTLM